jgi:hypothetical protein
MPTTSLSTQFKMDALNGKVNIAGTSPLTYKMLLIKVGATGTYNNTLTNVGTPGTSAPSTTNVGTDGSVAHWEIPSVIVARSL